MSFKSNYIKIYFWQSLSILLGFLSLFVVTPSLSSNKSIFGVYSLCVSLTIFMSYVDFGFIGAGYKFASEAVARKDRDEEYRIIGFISFILFIFGAVYALTIIGISFSPRVIFSGLTDGLEMDTARRLLLILGLFSLNLLYQRIIQVVLGVRLEDYILRRFSIVASCATILSLFWFFRKGTYDIVGYYLFAQTMSALTSVAASAVIVKRLNYSLRALFGAFKFDRAVFARTKGLAFSSLFATGGWILYYELDSVFISKMIGVSSLAYYSVCLTLLNFVRSMLGTLFAPFQARFNHFQGLNDEGGLKAIYSKVILITKPLVVFPIITLFMLMEPFIYSWIGPGYYDSVLLGKVLICIYSFAFFQYPAGILLTTQLRLREMNILTLVNVVIFWTGTLLTYKNIGTLSLAIFKLLTFLVSGVYYIIVSARFEKVHLPRYLWGKYLDMVIPCAALILGLNFLSPLFPRIKGTLVMFEVVGCGALATFLSLCFFILLSREYRSNLRSFLVRT